MTPLYLRVEASSQKQLCLQPRWATGQYGNAPAFIGEDGTGARYKSPLCLRGTNSQRIRSRRVRFSNFLCRVENCGTDFSTHWAYAPGQSFQDRSGSLWAFGGRGIGDCGTCPFAGGLAGSIDRRGLLFIGQFGLHGAPFGPEGFFFPLVRCGKSIRTGEGDFVARLL